MKTVKTAISIQQSLFDQADRLSRKLNVSRSRLFGLAVEEFIQRHKSQTLLDDINRAYEDEPDVNEKARLTKMREQQRKLIEGEW